MFTVRYELGLQMGQLQFRPQSLTRNHSYSGAIWTGSLNQTATVSSSKFNTQSFVFWRGMNWVFKSDSYSFVLKSLTRNRSYSDAVWTGSLNQTATVSSSKVNTQSLVFWRGTNWVFKSDSYSFILKSLTRNRSYSGAVRTGSLNKTATVSSLKV